MRIINYSRMITKKTMSKMAIFVFFFIAFSSNVDAQVFNPLINEDLAIEKLEVKVQDLNRNLENLDPSTKAYYDVERSLNLHNHTYEMLMGGEEVRSALISAFLEFAEDSFNKKPSQDVFASSTPQSGSYGDPLFDQLVLFLER